MEGVPGLPQRAPDAAIALDDAAPLYRDGDGGDAIETDDEGDDQPPLDYDTDDFERDGFNLVDDDDDSEPEPEPSKKQKN